MKKYQTLEGINNIIGLLVGLITFATVVTPIFTNNFLSAVFIDDEIIKVASIFGTIVLLLTIWFTASIDMFVFLGQDYSKMSKYRFIGIIVFSFSVVILYMLSQLYITGNISFAMGSILQILLYMFIFISAGTVLGLTLQSTIMSMTNKRTNEDATELITNTLTKTGRIKTQFIIHHIGPYNGLYNVIIEYEDKEGELLVLNYDLSMIINSKKLSKDDLSKILKYENPPITQSI